MNPQGSPEASLLSKIFLDASLPIIIEDLDGRVTAMNPAAESAYGWSNQELLGLPIKTIVPIERHAEADELLRRCKSGEIVRDIESVRVAKDGSRIPVLLTLSLLRNIPESELRVASMATDISSLKAAEHELRAYYEKLEARVQERTAELESTLEQLALARRLADRANEAKSQFLANMSHEIRTPMNAIIGLTHLCLQSDLGKKQRGFLSKVQESSQILLSLVNDILDFSKIEAHKLKLEVRDFDLDQLLEQQANFLAHSAWEKELNLLFSCASEVPRLLRGDSLRIGQILTNLISNAIKFTDAGEVRLTITAWPLQGGKYGYEFSVSDSGIGIDPTQLDELFESFQQADSSITRRFGGTGLGLAICKQLVELMGGTIGVDSRVGIGSRFWFRLELEAFSDRRQQHSVEGRALLLHCSDLTSLTLKDFLQACNWSWTLDREEPSSLVLVEGEQFHQPEDIELLRQHCLQNPNSKVVILSQGSPPDQPDSDQGLYYLPFPLILGSFREFLLELFDESQVRESQIALQDADSKVFNELKVLVVEDHPINREVLSEFLRSVGAEVKQAVNGEVACRMALGGEFDLILMDVQMPVMDGIAAARKLRESGFLKPIIAVTANVSGVDQQRYLSAGMDGFLGKPIDPKRLYESLAAFTFDKKILDYDFGLDSLRGNTDLYHRMLGDFFEEMDTFESRYQACDSLDERRRMAHSLVGVSGNLGLPEVSRLARVLEATPDSKVLADLLKSFEKVRQSYRRQERRGTYPTGATAQKTRLVTVESLRSLETLLLAADTEALTLALSLRPSPEMEEWEAFVTAIEDFEFETALEILVDWL